MGPTDVLPALLAQRRHQVRTAFTRRSWILLPALSVALLAFGLLVFGWMLMWGLAWPFVARGRIVPYFAREIGPYPGASAAAFRRGHDLYRHSAALERLAGRLGVTPLSAFGFGDDLVGQPVRWSAAADGLRTVTALHAAVAADAAADAVAGDLDALARALRSAAEHGVGFALLLRVGGGDLQSAAIFEPRARIGRFW
jgi:hypothetical protein